MLSDCTVSKGNPTSLFLMAAGLLPSQVDVHVLLAFMEYLCQNSFTPSNISNYLAGIRAYCVIYNICTISFRDEKIQMFIKSLKINRPLIIKNTSIPVGRKFIEKRIVII